MATLAAAVAAPALPFTSTTFPSASGALHVHTLPLLSS